MNLLKLVSSKSDRTKSIVKHIGLSSIYKIGAIFINLLLVPLSIKYLGSETYGLWLTLFSFIGWFSFFDFGIGHGLRNKLTEALSNKNITLAREYVSTAYFSIVVISIFLIFLFILIFPFVKWEILFNYSNNKDVLYQLIFIVYIIFSVNLVMKLITIIFFADQKSSIPGLLNFLSQVIIVLSIYIALYLSFYSLLFYGIIILGSQLIIFILFSLFYFFGQYKEIRPSLNSFRKLHVKEILSLGGKFFVIQIAVVILYSTDNFIINYIFGGESVTIYNIAFKYFSIVIMGVSIILAPFWSAFTEAFVKNDLVWIRGALRNLIKIIFVLSILTIFMIFISDSVYMFWVGPGIIVPYSLSIIMGINTILTIFMQLLAMMINGVGKVKLQLYISVFAALINIPLSIFFAVNLDMGISGVILATLVCNMFGFIIYPIQVWKIVNGSAQGIWNA